MMTTQRGSVYRSIMDPAGKGILGCFFFLVIAAVAVFVGIRLGPIYYANSNLQSAISTEVSRAGANFLDDETIIKDVLDLAKRNEIQLTRENVKVERFAGQIHITVQYTVLADLGFYQRNIDFNIRESSFVGRL
jgi:hypothetical protein